MENILIIEHEDHVRNELGSYSERLGYKPILISDPLICKAANSELKQCPTKKPCAELHLYWTISNKGFSPKGRYF
jgi:hypothetical protein